MRKLSLILVILCLIFSNFNYVGAEESDVAVLPPLYFVSQRVGMEDIPNDLTADKSSSSAAGSMIREFPAVGAASLGSISDPNVNLANGQFGFSVPLVGIEDVNGLSLGLSLNYNSDVDKYSRPEDWDGAQPSWVGAGWSLDVGSINFDVETGKEYLSSPGASGELLSRNYGLYGEKELEYDPYTKVYVDGQVGSEDAEVVLADGTKYIFEHTRQAPKFEREITSYDAYAWNHDGIGAYLDYLDHNAFIGPSASQIFTSADNAQIVDDSDLFFGQSNCYIPSSASGERRIIHTGTTVYDNQVSYYGPYALDLTQIEDTNGNKIHISYTDEIDYSPEELRRLSFTDNRVAAWSNGAIGTYQYIRENGEWVTETYLDIIDNGIGNCIPDVGAGYVDDLIDWENSEGFGREYIYTKSSYIDEINFPSGKSIEFNLGDRSDWSDPMQFYYTEGNMKLNGKYNCYIYNEDGSCESGSQCRAGECATTWKPYLYGTKKLNKISVKAPNGEVEKEIVFVYEYLNLDSSKYKGADGLWHNAGEREVDKLFLTEVYEYYPSNGQSLPGYNFGYLPDGKLEKITYPTGGEVVVNYDSFNYGDLNSVDKGTVVAGEFTSNLPSNVVSSLTKSDGMGDSYTTTYDYLGTSNLADCDYVNNINLERTSCGIKHCVIGFDFWGNQQCIEGTYSSDNCEGTENCHEPITCPITQYDGFKGCKEGGDLIFNKVKETLPADYGYTEYYFYNDLGMDSIINGYELQGLNYLTKSFTSSGNLVQQVENTFEAAQVAFGTEIGAINEYNRRIKNTKTTVDNVESITDYEYYNFDCNLQPNLCPTLKKDANGAPKKTITYGNDGKQVITETTPLFLDPAWAVSVRDKNILNLPSMSKVYDESGNILKQDIFSYRQFDNVAKLSQTKSLINPPSSSAGDIVTNFLQYDSKGNLLEAEDSLGNSQKVYYGNNDAPCVNPPSTNEMFTLEVYMPGQCFDQPTYLYVSQDGSTYYDQAMTQLAAGPGRNSNPMLISDVNNAYSDDPALGGYDPGYPGFMFNMALGQYGGFGGGSLGNAYLRYPYDDVFFPGGNYASPTVLKVTPLCELGTEWNVPSGDYTFTIEGIKSFGAQPNLNPTCIENSLGQKSIMKYDSKLRPTESIDANGFSTYYYYDSYGRLSSSKFEGDSFNSFEYTYNYGLKNCENLEEGNEECMNWVRTKSVIDGSENLYSAAIAYTDGLARPIRTKIVTEGTAALVSDTIYNDFSKVDTVTEPTEVQPSAVDVVYGKIKGLSEDDIALTYGDLDVKSGVESVKNVYYKDPLARVSKVFPLGMYNGDDSVVCGSSGNVCTQTAYWGQSSNFFTSVVDANGKLTKSKTDLLGNTVQVTDANLKNTNFEYDSLGNLKKVTDTENRISVTNNYDKLGRLTSTNDLNSGASSYTYDLVGNVKTIRDSNNDVTEFFYDELNRLIYVEINGVKTLENYYDVDSSGDSCVASSTSVGFLCELKDYIHSTSESYIYDKKGNVIRVINKVGVNEFITYYDYDDAGNVVKVVLPNNDVTEYRYNKLNQIETVSINGVAQDFVFDYTDLGMIDQINYPDGSLQDFSYNDRNWLDKIEVKDGNSVLTFGEQYNLYDNVGNLISMIDLVNGGSATFNYDNLYRLSSFVNNDYYDGPSVGFNELNGISYLYNSVGNRMSQTVDGNGQDIVHSVSSYVYGNDDKLDSADGCNYLYNNIGAVTSKICAEGTTNYYYDINNRLSKIEMYNDDVLEFGYDALGRRVWKSYLASGETEEVYTMYIYGAGSNPNIVIDPYYCIGDIFQEGNSNGVVDLSDVSLFSSQFGLGAGEYCDLFEDGVCDLSDLALFSGTFNLNTEQCVKGVTASEKAQLDRQGCLAVCSSRDANVINLGLCNCGKPGRDNNVVQVER